MVKSTYRSKNALAKVGLKVVTINTSGKLD